MLHFYYISISSDNRSINNWQKAFVLANLSRIGLIVKVELVDDNVFKGLATDAKDKPEPASFCDSGAEKEEKSKWNCMN